MKKSNKYDDEKNYDHPEIAWIIIGGVVLVTLIINLYLLWMILIM